MGDVLSLFSVIIMKFKSKFKESKIYLHYDLPWEKLKAVRWMNERASANKAYVPTMVSLYDHLVYLYLYVCNFKLIILFLTSYYSYLVIFKSLLDVYFKTFSSYPILNTRKCF